MSQKKSESKNFRSKKIMSQKNLGPKKSLVPKKSGSKNFSSKIFWNQKYSGFELGHKLQCWRSGQKLGLSQQCPMTFPTIFQASSLYRSCKLNHRAACGNYSGPAMPLLIWAAPLLIWSARLTCDYNAISVQLQLQLPTGTQLGNSSSLKTI